ncbi:glycosyl hydrolase [Radiobacillus deserti]|uniref:glucan endo-1,3-beta-D-glucosidase n=1 Tax=Radiobacillus deserti TaxID=2594883 RepID=A0A516KDX4_9BACI|nr:glycosyl hydrolase [Radiobacillus deserti]QDP39613.1 carbohydrate-binding protein [Radiobacillus deserti]
MKKASFLFLLIVSVFLLIPSNSFAFSGEQPLGKGSYSKTLPPGATDVQSKIYRTNNYQGKMPTNDWWSNLAWNQYSQPAYPHPLAIQNQEDGFRIYNPSNKITANSACVCGWINDIHDFTVKHSNVASFPEANVNDSDDWFVSSLFKSGTNSMEVTYGHGSPYVYFQFQGGNPELSFYTAPTVWYGNASSSVLGVTIAGSHYALFGPSGSTWSGIGSTSLTNNLAGKNYFSVAALPDNSPETLQKFKQYAYSFVTDTKVEWSYNEQTSKVSTTYSYTTTAKEGSQSGTIFALYPHQWQKTSHPLLPYTYNSVRGTMKTAEGSSFTTSMDFTGVLPSLPNNGSYDINKLAQYVNEAEAENDSPSPDTYWVGKRLGKLATLAPIAEQVGDTTAANKFRNEIKNRLEDWFTASDDAGNINSSQLFYYNENWGTVIGYPSSYGTAEELNDHHFHYGYFIKAAAEIARVDKQWANDSNWGQMVELLIRDIANWDRNDDQFPFLRNFDPYAGHSWASGHANFGDGNNNESSSEAMNAWAGLILWGEATNDDTIRDLGIYLYTTEMNAINNYWFDVKEENHHPDFTRSTASMIWGGKTVGDGVWWTANPEEVHGINWLPITGASLYLTHYPEYTETNYNALVSENGGTNFDVWKDLIYMYRAISDVNDAKNLVNSNINSLTAEAGNSKANMYHWIYNLDKMGNADPSITADYPIYAVFNKNGKKTYVVYNMTNQTKTVRFSDGHTVTVEPNRFNIDNGGNPDDGGSDDNPVSLPAQIEAENFTAMSGVQLETTTDSGGGQSVGYIDVGDWLDYSIDVPSTGTYKVEYRVASATSNGQVQFKSGSNTLATSTIPNTGGWQSWQTISTNVNLNQGEQTIRLQATGYEFNINWIRITPVNGSDEHTTKDYTAGVNTAGNNITIYFKPTTPSQYVDVHYTVNGSNQQNFRMTNNNGTWEQVVSGLNSGDRVEYWFTYEKSGPQYDSPHYTFTK